MSGRGGYEHDEGNEGNHVPSRISEHDIEALLGDGTPADPSLNALGSLLRSIDLLETIPDAISARHIAAAALAVAATPPTDRLHPAAAPRRRRRLLRGALSGLTVKILLGATAALAVTGGAATAGILPDPVQAVFSDGAALLGIEIPHPDHAPTTTAAPNLPSTTTTTAATESSWALVAGTYTWASTSCIGSPIAVDYTVSFDGSLSLGQITGAPEQVDVAADRIEVRFSDGIRIRIDAVVDGDGNHVDQDERRDCSSGDDDGSDDLGSEGSNADEPSSDDPDVGDETAAADDSGDSGDSGDSSGGSDGDSEEPGD